MLKISVTKSQKKIVKLGSFLGLLVLLCFHFSGSPAKTETAVATNIVFPSDSRIINVRDFGAKGDGVNDDTAAIQKAILNTSDPQTNNPGSNLIYFPNGTYLVSQTLVWPKISYFARILQGQSQDGTTIILKNNAAGFSDSKNPKAVLSTFEGGQTGNAFRHSIYDLTVDVGSGNSGADGFRFTSNNQGGIRNVTIRSSRGQGRAGLAMDKAWPGPSAIANLRVIGFDYGIFAIGPEYSLTFENIVLENQRIAGISNTWNLLSIRHLTSRNTVPVIKSEGVNPNDARSFVVVTDGSFTGGSASNVAIEVNAGNTFLRNITTTGYQAAIKQGGKVVPGNMVTEYASHQIYSLFSSSQKSLNLPVQEIPTIPWDNINAWANVEAYGAKANDDKDDADGIQKALDSGKTTIYFPSGTYKISKTLHVRGNVHRIIGLESSLDVVDPLKSQTNSVFRFEEGNQDAVVLERFATSFGNYKYTWFEHASPKTLILRNMAINSAKSYQNTVGSGRLFIEDIVGGDWVFNQQQVWARQFNSENEGTKIVNNGGKLWILGLKTEKAGTVVDTKAGGQTEILGGLLYPIQPVPSEQPAFINNESSLSVSIAESSYAPD
ncbi:MAG: glycoside hydrolase family 55 protein, partial [Nostocaceae cyanobacterium]|nr:glycoside hydrolase family 55 protein [Nostocaceae cyanobacterium]